MPFCGLFSRHYLRRKKEIKPIIIIYGELKTGVQKKVVEVLSELLIEYTCEYPVCFQYGIKTALTDAIKIL